MINNSKKSLSSTLRENAITLLKNKSLKATAESFEGNTLKLIHELEVHQIELELQNEELRISKSIAQNSSDRYAELFDFAPSGYFILTRAGEIIDLNLSGAKMLGKVRLNLKNNMFSFFVSDDTKPIYNRFLKYVFEGKAMQSCELTLSINNGLSGFVYLTGIVNGDGEQCMINATDIYSQKIANGLIEANKVLSLEIKEKELKITKSTLASNKAQENERLTSIFLTNMSHEIKTPLNGILGFTSLLKDPELSKEKQQLCISMIEKNSTRMISLADNLMGISKLETGLNESKNPLEMS